MPTITTPTTGIEIFYEDHGDPAREVILLVMGLGAQLTLWPDELVEALVGEGFRVIQAGSAGHATVQAASRKHQLVILDLGLPDRDGVAFIRDYRALSSRLSSSCRHAARKAARLMRWMPAPTTT